MKKSLLAIVVLLFIGFVDLAADTIGESYEAAGIQVNANGWYFNNLDGSSSFSLSTGAEFFIVKNLSFGLGLGFSRDSDNTMDANVDSNINYAFVFNPSSSHGFILKTGLNFGMYYNIDDSYTGYFLWPHITAYYHITPRVAPFMRITAVSMRFGEYVDEIFDTYINLSVGLSYVIPTKDKVLIRTK